MDLIFVCGKIILKKQKQGNIDGYSCQFREDFKKQFIVNAVNMFLKCNFIKPDVFINVHISMFKKPNANFYFIL
jgi:hypothetical protein